MLAERSLARSGGASFLRVGVVLLLALGVFSVSATNARPASADLGIADWAKVGLGAAAAIQSTTIAAASAVSDVAVFAASAGGGAIATGATAAVSAAELAALEASYALPAAGTAAAATGVCVGTAGVACAVGGAAALAAGGYALYKMFGPGSGVQPNSDSAPAPTSTGYLAEWTSAKWYYQSTEFQFTTGLDGSNNKVVFWQFRNAACTGDLATNWRLYDTGGTVRGTITTGFSCSGSGSTTFPSGSSPGKAEAYRSCTYGDCSSTPNGSLTGAVVDLTQSRPLPASLGAGPNAKADGRWVKNLCVHPGGPVCPSFYYASAGSGGANMVIASDTAGQTAGYSCYQVDAAGNSLSCGVNGWDNPGYEHYSATPANAVGGAVWTTGETYTSAKANGNIDATWGTLAPPAPSATPVRNLVTTRQCQDANGNVTTVTGTGPDYTEAANVRALAAQPACPAGTSVKSQKVESVTKDGSRPVKSVMGYTAPSSILPGIDPAPVVLYVTLPDGSKQTCEQTPSPCADWSKDPNKTDKYECRQGSTVLALSECDGLANRYQPKTGTTSGTGCFDGMGLSPLTWPKGLIISPLKCLFIPSDAAVQAAGSSISNAWNGTAPATVSAAIGTVAAPVVALKDSAQQSCDGPEFVIPKLPAMKAAVTLHPLSTCNRLTTYLLGIYMPIATALVYLGGFFAGTRTVLKAFGADSAVEAV